MGVLHFDRHAEQVYVDDVNITEVTTTAIHPAEGIYKNGDCEDKQQLLDETKAELKRRSTPTVSYEADVLTLTKAGMDTAGVALGDRVLLVDTTFTPDLRLAGRVLQLEEDLLDPALTVITIGNIIERFTASSRSAEQRLDRVIDGTATWQSTSQQVTQNASKWDQVAQTVVDNSGKWNAAAGTLEQKSSKLGQRRHDPCRQATRLGCDRSDRERESQDVGRCGHHHRQPCPSHPAIDHRASPSTMKTSPSP